MRCLCCTTSRTSCLRVRVRSRSSSQGTRSRCGFNQLKAQFPCLTQEPRFQPPLMERLTMGEDAFPVGLPGSEQVVYHPREFVGGGGDRLGGAEFCTHPPVVAAQVRLAAMQ